LNAANTTPHPKPVSVDRKTSLICKPSPLIVCGDLNRHLQF
jgi:hypothetical protein